MDLRALRSLLAVSAVAAGAAAMPAGGAGTAAVQTVRNAALGPILVSAGGRTLYAERRGAPQCTAACARRWPPLVVSARAKPGAGPGVAASLLGTLLRRDGRLQVTYHGLALYRYAGDTRAGQVNGQGLGGGAWHAVSPAGAAVLKAAAGSAAPAGEMGGGTSSGTTTGPSPGVNAGMWCAANPQSCVNGVPVTH